MGANHAMAGDDDAIDLVGLARMLWSSKVLIAASAATFGAVAVVLALVATPIFRAETVVMPVADTGLGNAGTSLLGRLGGLASLTGIDVASGGPAVREALAVLNSRNLAEEFVRRSSLEDVLLPPGSTQSGAWFAVKMLRETVLSIRSDDVAGTTTVAMEWKDPETAARWANDYVALANELMRTKALTDSQRNIEYLKKQIEATNILEMQRVMYELIETESKTLMLANARVDYALRVVDPAAVPELRVRPQRKLMVLTGIALGGILAALFVLGRESVRRQLAREGGRGEASRP